MNINFLFPFSDFTGPRPSLCHMITLRGVSGQEAKDEASVFVGGGGVVFIFVFFFQRNAFGKNQAPILTDRAASVSFPTWKPTSPNRPRQHGHDTPPREPFSRLSGLKQKKYIKIIIITFRGCICLPPRETEFKGE